MIPSELQTELNSSYELSSEQIAFYQKNRFIKLKQVLSPECIDYFSSSITEEVEVLRRQAKPLDQRDTYGKAFLQHFNLWQKSEVVKSLVFSPRLAQIAAGLMKVDGVRLYHDQALFKEAGGGITPWHADQHYWPLATDKTITAWIPLQETPLEMGPLEFSAGSHQIKQGRELDISDESENQLKKTLRINDCDHVVEAFDLGEVSFHSGWVFHRAGANTTDQVRKVMTVIYMDRDMVLKEPENDGQKNDWKTWCPGAEIGQMIDTPLNPVLS
jgi:ectoine hydroxylase-related dioxygenase (phytanoyl-CoA dioxygenase family)